MITRQMSTKVSNVKESVVVHVHLILILDPVPEIKELRNKDGIKIKNKRHGWDVAPWLSDQRYSLSPTLSDGMQKQLY